MTTTPLTRFVNSSQSDREAIGNAAVAEADAEIAKMTAPGTAGKQDWLLKSTQDLAKAIARDNYPDVPQFEVVENLAGIISQIDNMTCGMVRAPTDKPTQGELTTCNCRWNGEEQVQSCTLHEAHVDAIHEWAERAKTAERELAATYMQPERVPNHTNEIVKLVNAARNGINNLIESETSLYVCEHQV